jgi:hypothetical protein
MRWWGEWKMVADVEGVVLGVLALAIGFVIVLLDFDWCGLSSLQVSDDMFWNFVYFVLGCIMLGGAVGGMC